jgi:endonuclease/exonuclease/phosphatase family metal-dependent hydrolase
VITVSGMVIVCWNICDGGFDDGRAGRLTRQLELLSDVRPDVALVQEAKHWLDNGACGLHLAERMLGMRGYLAAAPRHGCHVVVFVRPHGELEVVRERHQERHPFWHAQARVVCRVAGLGDPLVLASTHFAPFNPALRVEEACASSDLATGAAVLAGDFNDPGLEDPPADWGGLPGYKMVRHTRSDVAGWPQDDRAARVLREAGFVDVAAYLAGQGNPAMLGPTAGFGARSTPIRCDRIYVTEPLAGAIDHYAVMATQDSDHHVITARLAL